MSKCNIGYLGKDDHNGEYWYKCLTCGAEDWVSRYADRPTTFKGCTMNTPENMNTTVRRITDKGKSKISDGGPSDYYDFPDNWNTLNDFIEYKSEHQWKEHSFHLGNIVKALTRWGDKGGTSLEYDAKKIIYSGCRVLMKIVGKERLRDYLKSLLDDPQFKL